MESRLLWLHDTRDGKQEQADKESIHHRRLYQYLNAVIANLEKAREVTQDKKGWTQAQEVTAARLPVAGTVVTADGSPITQA